MFSTRKLTATTFLLAPVLCALAGCGGRVRVEGNVSLDGVPVEFGTISFFSGTGPGSDKGNAQIQDGKYVIEGERAKNLTPGSYKVQIFSNKKAGEVPNRSDPGTSEDQIINVIPPQFNTETTLTRDLKSGTNKLDFHLTSK
jgi:hypothetical protein